MTTTARFARLRRTTRRSALAAITVAATATLAGAPAADAAGPAPHFQMPVTCGQMWEATTYWDYGPDHLNHWPNANSLDLGMWDKDDSNISEGQPALASADGVVTKVYTNSEGEHRVFLDHGNGWETYYVHLESVPPLKVGQSVAQGQVIGRIGRSGAKEFHLHYTQLADGEAVRVRFDENLVATGQDDPTTWNKWPSRTGEQLTSSNCPGRSFVPFYQDGKRHVYAYESRRGAAGIASFNTDGSGVTNPWSATGDDRRWTHFMPFTLDGDQRFFSYAAATGAVEFDRIKTSGPTKLSAGTWGKGSTHFMPFTLGGKPYFVAYDSLTGGANVDRINAAGTGSTTANSTAWTTGWTQLAPFKLGSVQYFLAYRGSTGEVTINRIVGSGDYVVFTSVWKDKWPTGLTQIVPMVHEGAVQLLRYQRSTGLVSFDRVNDDGLGIQHLGSAVWTRSWATFSPFWSNGNSYVLGYKTNSGIASILKLNAGGGGVTTTATMGWTLGLA